MNAREWTTQPAVAKVTTAKLTADLRALAADIEQLLRATAGETGHHITQLRAKAEESLEAVRARAADLQRTALVSTRAAGRVADDYVHANPWQVMAIGAVVGLVIGLVSTRRGAPDS